MGSLFIREQSPYQYRARHHGDLCRIEVDTEDLARLLEPDTREKIVEGVLATGYKYVAMDLGGYRTGNVAAKPAENILLTTE